MNYQYRTCVILVISLLFIIPALADDVEWVDPQEKTLRLMEFVVRDGYYIEATDFYDNSSLISVYDANHNLISTNVTQINDWMNINDQVNITIKNLQEKTGNIGASHGLNVVVDQWVRIETRVSGRPIPRVSIANHEERVNDILVVRRSFIPNSDISINFSVLNEGKGVLKDTTLKIKSTLPLLGYDKLEYDLLDIGAGNESQIFTVRFMAPDVVERKIFTISAEVRGSDIFGKSYKAADSIDIEVKPKVEKRVGIRKVVTEKVYMGDVAVVSIFLKNNESRKIGNITLEEALPGGLLPVNTNLTWNFSLGPLEEKSISYMIKPQKPGTYFFAPGSSRIEYEDGLEYDKKLNKLIVNGPYVVLSKSSNIENPSKGDNITITVEAKNIGNAAAIARISDNVPANYSLGEGNISYSRILRTAVLRPGNSTSFSYILNIKDNGNFILPPVIATVLDQFLYQDERYTQKISSGGNLSIHAREPVILQEPVKIVRTPLPAATTGEVQTPVPASTVEETPRTSPGFQGYVFIILFIVIYLINKKWS